MEKIVAELKEIIRFKDTTQSGDVVLIAALPVGVAVLINVGLNGLHEQR